MIDNDNNSEITITKEKLLDITDKVSDALRIAMNKTTEEISDIIINMSSISKE